MDRGSENPYSLNRGTCRTLKHTFIHGFVKVIHMSKSVPNTMLSCYNRALGASIILFVLWIKKWGSEKLKTFPPSHGWQDAELRLKPVSPHPLHFPHPHVVFASSLLSNPFLSALSKIGGSIHAMSQNFRIPLRNQPWYIRYSCHTLWTHSWPTIRTVVSILVLSGSTLSIRSIGYCIYIGHLS